MISLLTSSDVIVWSIDSMSRAALTTEKKDTKAVYALSVRMNILPNQAIFAPNAPLWVSQSFNH